MRKPRKTDSHHGTQQNLFLSSGGKFDMGGEKWIELYRGDCFAGMKRLPEESIDVVVTSPPYNLGVKYGVYNDRVSRENYLNWLDEWASLVSRVLGGRGSLFLNIGGKPKDPWGPMEVALRFRKYFELQNTIHWIKSIAIDKSGNGDDHGLTENINVGHIKPINSPRYVSDAHEYVFHFTKFGDVKLDRKAIGVEYKHKSNITRWKSAGTDRRCRGNTWFIPYKTIVSRDRDRPHPASFPPRLAEMCIQLHGTSDVRTVMDPFMGLGNTALACVRLGKSCIGYEIDPEYWKVSCELVGEAILHGTGPHGSNSVQE
ncbi:MAG: site-specific DNA-methyltransferase [Desulfomonilaceae bacterium]|nr:site-specific DNA-methyltransferase [Desulfomonilaceae bacterium]